MQHTSLDENDEIFCINFLNSWDESSFVSFPPFKVDDKTFGNVENVFSMILLILLIFLITYLNLHLKYDITVDYKKL